MPPPACRGRAGRSGGGRPPRPRRRRRSRPRPRSRSPGPRAPVGCRPVASWSSASRTVAHRSAVLIGAPSRACAVLGGCERARPPVAPAPRRPRQQRGYLLRPHQPVPTRGGGGVAEPPPRRRRRAARRLRRRGRLRRRRARTRAASPQSRRISASGNCTTGLAQRQVLEHLAHRRAVVHRVPLVDADADVGGGHVGAHELIVDRSRQLDEVSSRPRSWTCRSKRRRARRQGRRARSGRRRGPCRGRRRSAASTRRSSPSCADIRPSQSTRWRRPRRSSGAVRRDGCASGSGPLPTRNTRARVHAAPPRASSAQASETVEHRVGVAERIALARAEQPVQDGRGGRTSPRRARGRSRGRSNTTAAPRRASGRAIGDEEVRRCADEHEVDGSLPGDRPRKRPQARVGERVLAHVAGTPRPPARRPEAP